MTRSMLAGLLALTVAACRSADSDKCGDGVWGTSEACDPTSPEWDSSTCTETCAWQNCTPVTEDVWAACASSFEPACESYCHAKICGDTIPEYQQVCIDPSLAVQLDLGEPMVDWIRQDIDGDGLVDVVIATASEVAVYFAEAESSRFVRSDVFQWSAPEGSTIESIGIARLGSGLYGLWVSIPQGTFRRIYFVNVVPSGWERVESAVAQTVGKVTFISSPSLVPMLESQGHYFTLPDYTPADPEHPDALWELDEIDGLPPSTLALLLGPFGKESQTSAVFPWGAWMVSLNSNSPASVTLMRSNFLYHDEALRIFDRDSGEVRPPSAAFDFDAVQLVRYPGSATYKDLRVDGAWSVSRPTDTEPPVLLHDASGRGQLVRVESNGGRLSVQTRDGVPTLPQPDLFGARLDGPGRDFQGLRTYALQADQVALMDDGRVTYLLSSPGYTSEVLQGVFPTPDFTVDEIAVDDLNSDGFDDLWLWNKASGHLSVWVNHP